MVSMTSVLFVLDRLQEISDSVINILNMNILKTFECTLLVFCLVLGTILEIIKNILLVFH